MLTYKIIAILNAAFLLGMIVFFALALFLTQYHVKKAKQWPVTLTKWAVAFSLWAAGFSAFDLVLTENGGAPALSMTVGAIWCIFCVFAAQIAENFILSFGQNPSSSHAAPPSTPPRPSGSPGTIPPE